MPHIRCEVIFCLLKLNNYSGCSALFQCIETLGNGCLTEEAMTELIRILDRIMKDHFSKAAARQEKRKDEDYDEVSIPAKRLCIGSLTHVGAVGRKNERKE
jgi:hypothetical protein